jgi:hypothetical protein
MSKRHVYPYFYVTGLVSVHEHGEYRPITKVQAGGHINFKDDVFGVLKRDAMWRLNLLGVTKERIDTLFFEDQDITHIKANCAKGLKSLDDEETEAFFDYPEIAKRATLIRQRRLVPQDHADMVAMYGPKWLKLPVVQAAKEDVGVAA